MLCDYILSLSIPNIFIKVRTRLLPVLRREMEIVFALTRNGSLRSSLDLQMMDDDERRHPRIRGRPWRALGTLRMRR